MKKKALIPSILGAAVFLTGMLCQWYSFIHQEELGLFLTTPDYLRETFSNPLPLGNLAGSFLVQFYDIALVGPAVTALLVMLTWLCAAVTCRRITIWWRIPATVIACAAWWFIARADGPVIAVCILSWTAAAALVSLLLRPKGEGSGRAVIPASLGIIAAACLLVASSPSVRKTEQLSRLEHFTRNHEWDKVLETATPKVCAADRSLLPYAMLALNAQGRLTDEMGRYPVQKPEDLDMEGVQTREGYWFSSLLCECLGCPNEAVHLLFQSACHLPHGTSHLMLRQLIRYNIELGNYTMVRKYAEVLSRSPRNRAAARKIIETYGNLDDVDPDPGRSSAEAAVITNNPIFNIVNMYREGLESPIMEDRMNAYGMLGQGE